MTAKKLFNDNYQAILRFIYFKVGNKELAEDILSQVWEALLKEDLQDLDNPRAWLYKVAKFKVADYYRSGRFSKTEAWSDNLNRESSSLNTEATGLNRALIEQIERKLGEFDEETSSVIALKTWDGLTFREIAEVLEEKESTVKQRYYRGIEKLKIEVNSTHNKSFSQRKITAVLSALGTGIMASLPTQAAAATATTLSISAMGAILTMNKLLIGVAATVTTVTVAGGAFYLGQQSATPPVQEDQNQMTTTSMQTSSRETISSTTTSNSTETTTASSETTTTTSQAETYPQSEQEYDRTFEGQLQLAFVQSAEQGDPEAFGCLNKLAFVNNQMVTTDTPIETVLDRFFAAKEPAYGSNDQFRNMWRFSDINVQSVEYTDENSIEVNLTGEVVSGGTCADPALYPTLMGTITQFDWIDEKDVTIYMNGQDFKEFMEEFRDLRG